MATYPPDTDVLQAPIPEAEGFRFNDESLRGALTSILDTIETEEQPSREILIRTWKYYDLLWEGIQPIFWNAVDREWQLINKVIRLPNNIVIDPFSFNKSINIIRAYGESISGAITTGLPKVNYFPENADEISDIQTAKAYSKIERIIAEHNEMELKLLKAALTYWRFGFVAAYNYSHESKSYGVIEEEEYEDVSYTMTEGSCPNCAEILSSKRELTEELKEKKTDLTSGTALTGDELLEEPITCQQCNQQVLPITNQTEETINELAGIKEIPHARQIVDFYSPLEVKIPIRAKREDEVLWVVLEEEYHYSQLRSKFPEYFDKITGGESSHRSSSYERWARSNYEIDGETLENSTTLQRVWLSKEAFYILDKEKAQELSRMYPEGIYFGVINSEVVEIKGEDLNDHWTFTKSPGDRRIIAVPPAKNVVPIQELTNDIMGLEVKSLKHSIPTAFADPEYFNFEAYKRTRKEPGLVYQMKLPPGGRMSDAIAELRTSVLPKEAADLDAKLERFGQFLSGAFPSVFGGPAAGSKTAYEYKESRNNALQRLGIIWKIITQFYANTMHKAVRGFIDNMITDEVYSKEQGNSYINVWIKKAELQGKIGRVSPEISEQFPTSWAQKRTILLELLGMQKEMIDAIVFHPENIGLLSKLIGIDELYVPGDNDRNKQLEEIQKLVTSAPIVDEMGNLHPSIPTDPMLDIGVIHIEVMRAFASSDLGQYIRENEPEAWQNFMLHLAEHEQYQQEMLMQQQQAENQSEGKGTAPQEQEREELA